MKYALFTLTSTLHRETAENAAQEPFIKDIEKELGEEFEFCGEDFSTYGKHDKDIIYVRTGGTEGLFARHAELTNRHAEQTNRHAELVSASPRILLLTSGKSNSLAASMEILSYLRQNGQEGEILHGSSQYIAGRIKQSGRHAEQTNRHAELVSASPFISPLPSINLEGLRLGVIGKPSDWLISSNVDYAKAKRVMNAELVDIPMSELLSRIPSDIDMRSFAGSEAIYDALKGIVKDFRLGGLTLRCFDLLDTVHNTGCLALARLNAEGIPSSCEGDIPALLSMAYLQKTTGCPGFQCNLSRINGDELLFAHCTIPLTMVRSYKYATHFESGIGTAIKGELPEGEVEIFKISPDLEHCVRIPGRLLRNTSEPDLCRTQIIVSAPGSAPYFLRESLANHHIITFR